MFWNLLTCVDLLFGLLLRMSKYGLDVNIQSGIERRLELDGATGCVAPHQFPVKFMPFLIIAFYTRWSFSTTPEVTHDRVVCSKFKEKSEVRVRVNDLVSNVCFIVMAGFQLPWLVAMHKRFLIDVLHLPQFMKAVLHVEKHPSKMERKKTLAIIYVVVGQQRMTLRDFDLNCRVLGVNDE